MTDTAARIEVLRDALRAAATGDQLLIERVYTEDVTGWSPVLDVTSRDDLSADRRGRRVELRGVFIAEFEGDRIRAFRQYWDEAELLDGLGLLPGD